MPRSAAVRLRAVGNLVNLSTPLGLLVAATGRATVRRGPRGLLLAERFRLPSGGGAFTVGDVVITRGTWAELLSRHPALLEHEERHAWQYLCWLGLPFLPAYGVATLWSLLRTGHRAYGNPFERRAGLASGGYLPPDAAVSRR